MARRVPLHDGGDFSRPHLGEFVMHCHILDHEDSGIRANVLIVPDLTPKGGSLGMPGMKTMSNGTITQ